MFKDADARLVLEPSRGTASNTIGRAVNVLVAPRTKRIASERIRKANRWPKCYLDPTMLNDPDARPTIESWSYIEHDRRQWMHWPHHDLNAMILNLSAKQVCFIDATEKVVFLAVLWTIYKANTIEVGTMRTDVRVLKSCFSSCLSCVHLKPHEASVLASI